MSIHSTRLVRVAASACAIALVISSAGFGAVFAWKIGIEHSYLLACLTVLFAVALEGIKPLAISAAFQAQSFLRGLCLLILGLVAVAYSLTSELSLMATSRGDLRAHREQASETHRMAQERHSRAKQELASLKPSRPVRELEALAKAPSKERCAVENGTGKWVCPSKPGIQAELGRAKRRAELEAILDVQEQALADGPTAKVADPGSTALATYLGSLGIAVSVNTLAQWLNLVPVLALELGSALAMVLVSGLQTMVPKSPEPKIEALPEPQILTPEPPTGMPLVKLPRPTEAIAALVLNHLKTHGGSISSTERGLAAVLGTSKPTIRRTIQALSASGMVVVQASKQGTRLQLA